MRALLRHPGLGAGHRAGGGAGGGPGGGAPGDGEPARELAGAVDAGPDTRETSRCSSI